MNYTTKFVTYWLVNCLVLLAARALAPDYIVFGRAEIGAFQALLTTAFGIALGSMFVDLAFRDFNIKLTPDKYMTAELVVNIAVLYVLARTPLQNSVGVGIEAFWVALVAGVFLSVMQYVAKRVAERT